ncbi:hypothetical protein NIES4071_62820 [Calothrix sp. NIES-4071]|nr:hypothetical protein NIES4071_62820 [Calothrix sp. NIES-4071]BAZ60585.1 hypothetical protein NIES4105_62770 [Calothrix sp. NIES-4105]
MKINQLTYYDKKIGWHLDPIQFSDLNLLVGISGVGKTQILKSIMNMRAIARGRSLNGAMWDVEFSINNNTYQWQGEFEHNTHKLFPIPTSEELDNKFRILTEHLYLNNHIIIERDSTQINFKGNKLPKLSSFTSAISILSEEEDIYPVTEGFNRIYEREQSKSDYNLFDDIYHTPTNLIVNYDYYENLANQNCDLETIQESHLPIQMKLGLAYKHKFSVFQEIKQQFINMFEHVEDIKVEPDKNETIPKVISEYPLVEIKEKGVNMWIKQNQISSGMFKTLMHISELYLSADGTIILIDEFENSLGVNCIDILTDLLIQRKLQFIITSHHPYIINKIDMEHWKIITRKGSVVTAKQVKEFNFPKSRHQAFMQLINLDAYREGIAVG